MPTYRSHRLSRLIRRGDISFQLQEQQREQQREHFARDISLLDTTSSRSWSLYKVHHLWNMFWLKLVDVFIRLSLIKLMSRSIPLNGLLPMTAVPQRPRRVSHIYNPWIVDGLDLYSCLILNYMNIISSSFYWLEQIPWVIVIQYHVVRLVWSRRCVCINSLDPFITTCEGKWIEKKVIISFTSNIICWDKQHQMSYPSSCLFMYLFTHRDNSSIASQDICFSIPIGFCMTEPDRFHYYTFVDVVEIAMCLEKIEYQPWHLSNTLISSDDGDTRKKDF